MSRGTNARIAGATFLVYIAAGITGLAVPTGVLVDIVLSFMMCFSALVLAVTLYAITRDVDPHLAMMGLVCRAGEGILGAMFMPAQAALRSLGTSTPTAPDRASAEAIQRFVASAGSFNTVISAMFFAVGSLAFCYLFLRGRVVPAALAWIGLVASVVLVIGLPLRLAGFVHRPVTDIMWLPMLAFEVPVGLWLIAKGVGELPRAAAAQTR